MKKQVTYNRNGVSGESFYTVTFHDKQEGTLVAVVPVGAYQKRDNSSVYVINPLSLVSNYRGDTLAQKVFDCIEHS